jgi:hypothetical protein
MELYKELGTYSAGMIRTIGSFQLNGAGAPTILRDATNVASAKKRFSVVRTSIGLYTVTMLPPGVVPADKYPLPVFPFIEAWVDQAAVPTAGVTAKVVKGSWSSSARTFQIAVNLTSTFAASDGDAADRVNFRFEGSITAPGTDPA